MSDTQSGTICFRKSVIKDYKFKSKGFELLVELILLFKNYKVKVIKADFIHRRKGRFNVVFNGIPMLIRLKRLKC